MKYVNTNLAIRKHVKDKYKRSFKYFNTISNPIKSLGEDVLNKNPSPNEDFPIRNQTIYINQSGIYSLVFKSNQKQAEKFQD